MNALIGNDEIRHIAVGLLAFLGLWGIASLVGRLISREMKLRNWRTDTVLLLSRVVYVGLVVAGVILFFSIAFSTPSFIFNSVLIAALITSLGFQDLVKNYVSGFYILFEGNLKVGDIIESGGYTGEVTDVRMRNTYLRGEAGELIVIPNSELFSKPVQVKPPKLPPVRRSRARRG